MKKLTKQQEEAIARAVRLVSSEAINSEYIASQMEIDAYNDLYADFYAD